MREINFPLKHQVQDPKVLERGHRARARLAHRHRRHGRKLFAALFAVGCGTTTTTTDGGTDGSTPAMKCPSTVPANGSPCDVMIGNVACEYGADSRGQCATLAECYAGSWHITPPATTCNMNSSLCPASFSALAEGSPCPVQDTTCFYPEGGCGCAPCEVDGGMSGQWKCRTWSSAGMGCPAPRVPLGSACTTEGLECDYNGCCTGVSLGRSEVCKGGQWQTYVSGACTCARFPCK
jgi:hypothetical protein